MWRPEIERFNEAPIHESGKLQAVRPEVKHDRASMRPRFMNRGSPGVLLRSAAVGGRFNEAPIHESGKCRSRPVRAGARRRFNEAPIHESGKCGTWAVTQLRPPLQ